MKTMIIGNGGREHALATAAQEACSELYAPNPNAGMEQAGVRNLGVRSYDEIVDAAWGLGIDLAIIGPESPLIHGLADALRAENIPTLGVNSDMAQMEGSKAFAAAFMCKYEIPHPATYTTTTHEGARAYMSRRRANEYVVKADGEAAGKGVWLPKNRVEAERIVSAMLSGELFGEAGEVVNFQERLHGQEISMIALLDGKKAHVLGFAQDYKRLRDGDEGPNTGGMGSYTPVSHDIINDRRLEQMYDTLEKTLYGLNRKGLNSPGFLYIGFLMAEEYGGYPMTLEYNVRSGDPETQVIVPSLQAAGVDVHGLFEAAAHGSLEGDEITVAPSVGQFAVTRCLASEGYPDNSQTGRPIYGLNRDYPGITIYHGGTKRSMDEGGRVLTNGGRVLYPTALGETPGEAIANVNAAIGDAGLYFEGMQYRTDIGHQAIRAEQ